MDWLSIIGSLIALSIGLYLYFQKSRFTKEFKGAIHDDRSLSRSFAHRWEKKFSRQIILIIIATIFGIIAILLSK